MGYSRGDMIEVQLDRRGLGDDEGVGHLEDDTMVVVVGGGALIGEKVKATVVAIESTFAGSSLVANAEF